MAEPEKLSAAQRGKIRRLSAPKELAADEEGGELNIVPFLDIIMNVLMFVLATVAVTFTATIDTFPPRRGGGRGPTVPTLNLTLLIVPDGFSLKASGSGVGAGCVVGTGGVTVPRNSAGYDYNGLTTCVKKIKDAVPDALKDEDSITISGQPNTPYQVVISAIDAVRKDDQGNDMFPNVNFGVAR